MSGVALRPATAADVALLRRWDDAPHVVASDPNDDWQWETELGRDLPWRAQLIAEVDGAAIGYVEVLDPARDDERYWGDCGPGLRAIDIWIGEAAYLGQGHGTQMMRLALARCFADPEVDAVVIDPLVANAAAIRFYRRLGFAYVEDRWFGADHCAVHRLDRARWVAAAGDAV